MPTFNDLTSFDYCIVSIFFVFFIRGMWIGCMRQLGAVLALVGGYYLAGHYASTILPYTKQFIASPKVTFLVSYTLIFFVAALVFTAIGRIMHRFMRITLLGWLDRLGGVCIGGLKAMIVASLIYMVLASTLSTTNDLLRKSYTTPLLKEGADILRALIQDTELQQYFVQKEPAIRRELHRANQQKIQL
nr:CvpA family protein [uncultured Desulfobulbus sp.]